MQLLPPPIQAIAPYRCIQSAVMLVVEFLAKPAVVLVGFANVLQFARDEFQDDDVVEVTDDRLIGRFLLRNGKVKDTFTIPKPAAVEQVEQAAAAVTKASAPPKTIGNPAGPTEAAAGAQGIRFEDLPL